MIQIRKKENQKQPKEKKPRVYKANTHKRIVIALWVLPVSYTHLDVYKRQVCQQTVFIRTIGLLKANI